MFLLIYVNDEGFTDTSLRDGDIFQVQPDDYVPGEKTKQRFLVVQTPDFQGNTAELVESEFQPGPGADPVIRRMRKYRVNYAPKLSPDELLAARDPLVTVEPIVGVFDLSDIARK